MTTPIDRLPTHKDDFGRVYDLEDPSPYFTALGPADYRMPAVLARTLKAIHRPVATARNTGGVLRLLDFACGYGVIGALLRHSVSLADMYAWYGGRQWQPSRGVRKMEGNVLRKMNERREREQTGSSEIKRDVEIVKCQRRRL